MDGANFFRNIHDRGAERASFADKPVIPPDAPDDERRNFLVKTAGKKKVVNVVIEALDALAFCERNDLLPPIGTFKMHRLGDVRIPTAADHKVVWVPGSERAMRFEKILREDDVAVCVTDGLMFCDLLGAAEDGVETLRAELRAEDFRFVARAKFAADFCRAFIVAEDDDFDVGMEEFPGLERVALDHVDVTAERFGSGEEGEHQARFPASVEMFDLRRTNPPSA